MDTLAPAVDEIFVDEQGDEDVAAVLAARLKEANEATIGPYEREPFNIYVRATDDAIIAGINGEVLGDLCSVKIVWVDSRYRRQGLGRKLFASLETFAKQRRCHHIQLYTNQFQAKDFYEKLGFTMVAWLPKNFLGHDTYFMRKAVVS